MPSVSGPSPAAVPAVRPTASVASPSPGTTPATSASNTPSARPVPSPSVTPSAPSKAPAGTATAAAAAAASAKATADLEAAKAAAEALKLSAKAEAALRVRSTDMFSETKVKHSKIFDALNPQPLAFQTARDRADREDVEVLGSLGVRGYAEASLALGDSEFVDDSMDAGGEDDGEEEEEEPFDPHNLPDFGEFTGEMLQRRAERAAAEQRRREALQREAAARRAREQAEMEKELESIRAREAIENKKKKVDDSFVIEAQKRLESELSFGSFVFQ